MTCKHYLLTGALFLTAQAGFGQAKTDTLKPHLLTADSLASGNYKDVFTSFFQLAANDLSGPNKALDFASNPFAIMARGNPALLVDTNYVKYSRLRNLNFNTGVVLDSAYRLSGFNFGIKYAIVNKRDVSISHKFIGETMSQSRELDTLVRHLSAWASKYALSEPGFTDSLVDMAFKWENNDTFTFNKFTSRMQDTITAIISNKDNHMPTMRKLMKDDPNLVFKKVSDSVYNEIKGEWQNKPLWTVSGNSTFASQNAGNLKTITASNVLLSTEFLAGLNAPAHHVKWDLDLLANYRMTNDSTNPKQNIQLHTFEFQPGFNFVLKSSSATNGGPGKPYLEFKISGSYYHTFTTLQPGQKADSNTINAVLRLRVFQDIWVPVTILYDPANGNVFGFLSVKANFTALAGALKKLEGAE